MQPSNPYIRGKLGTTLGKAGRYAEAITERKEAVRLKPDLAEAHLALGLAYFEQGNRMEATREVQVLSGLNEGLADQLRRLVNNTR